MRDLSRVYEGLCIATSETISTSGDFLRLWRNECDRIFCDRLTTSIDQQTYANEIQAILKDNFSNDEVTQVLKEPCMFGDFEDAVKRLAEANDDDSGDI